jgi:hypothetical protein
VTDDNIRRNVVDEMAWRTAHWLPRVRSSTWD